MMVEDTIKKLWRLVLRLYCFLIGSMFVPLRRDSPRTLDDFGFTVRVDPDLPPDIVVLQNPDGTGGIIYNIRVDEE